MALAAPTVLYAINGGASSPLAPSASVPITVGVQLTLSPQSTVGMTGCTFSLRAPGTVLDGQQFVTMAPSFSTTIQLPVTPTTYAINCAVSDGENVTSSSTFFIATPVTSLLGRVQVSADLTNQEDAQGRVLVPAAQTVNIYTLPSPSMADQETVVLATHVIIKGQTSGAGESIRLMRGTNSGGTFTNFIGGTSDTDLTADPANALASSLAGFTCHIVPSGNTLVVQCVGAASQGAYVVVADSSARRFTAPGSVPAPTIASIDVSSGPGTGGTIIHVVGTGFTTAASVTVCGTSASFLPPIDDLHLTITTGSFFGVPGVAGDIVIQNASASATLPASFTYTTTLATTPNAIMGVILRAQYENTGIQQSGGACTSWTDVSGLGFNLTAVASPVYNNSSGSISPAGPTASLNGSTRWFTKTSFVLGGTGFFAMVVLRATSSSAGWVAEFSSNLIQLLGFSGVTPGHYDMTNSGSGAVANFGSSNVNQTVVAWGYTDHAIGAGNRVQVGVNTTSPVSSSGTSGSSQSAGSGTLTLGGNGAGFQGEMVAGIICNALPSAGQLQLMLNYYHGLYGT